MPRGVNTFARHCSSYPNPIIFRKKLDKAVAQYRSIVISIVKVQTIFYPFTLLPVLFKCLETNRHSNTIHRFKHPSTACCSERGKKVVHEDKIASAAMVTGPSTFRSVMHSCFTFVQMRLCSLTQFLFLVSSVWEPIPLGDTLKQRSGLPLATIEKLNGAC